jgi:hypothetical protein
VSVCGDDLIIRTPSGEQPFRALSKEMDRFSSVGPVDTRMIAAFSQRSDGTALLSLGHPNPQGQFQAFVVLARQGQSSAAGEAGERPLRRGEQ